MNSHVLWSSGCRSLCPLLYQDSCESFCVLVSRVVRHQSFRFGSSAYKAGPLRRKVSLIKYFSHGI